MVAADLPDPWMSRRLAGRYRLDSLIGLGGMSRVYRALDLQSVEPESRRSHSTTRTQAQDNDPVAGSVAVKVLLGSLVRDRQAQERFQREIVICSNLQDRRVVHVLDHGITPPEWGPPQRGVHEQDWDVEDPWPGSPYMVMEFVSGRTLQEELLLQPRISVKRTLRLARHLVAGLRAIHDGVVIEGELRQIVHRDLSPGNIYLVQDAQGRESTKLGDFGLARYVGEIDAEGLIRAGVLWGTLAYASPEQLRGGEPIDPRSDIYSLGCILYEMLTGTHPLGISADASTPEWMHAHIAQSPRPFPHQLDIPLVLQQLVIRCLEKDAENRFDSVMSLDAALQLAQQDLLTPTPAVLAPPAPVASRRAIVWPWIALFLLPVVIGAGWLGYRWLRRSPSPQGADVLPVEASESDPDQQIRARLLRGLVLLQKGEHVEAAVQFEEAVQLDPDNARAQAGLGIAFSRLGRLDRAEPVVQVALELGPEDSFVRTARGIYLMERREWEQAKQEFQRAIHLNPNNYLAQAALEALAEAPLIGDAAE